MWGQFWSAHQRYFKYLCISAKVPHCIKVAREAVKNGKVSINCRIVSIHVLVGNRTCGVTRDVIRVWIVPPRAVLRLVSFLFFL